MQAVGALTDCDLDSKINEVQVSLTNFLTSLGITEDDFKNTMMFMPEYKAPEGAYNNPWSKRWLAIGYILGRRGIDVKNSTKNKRVCAEPNKGHAAVDDPFALQA